MRNLVAKQPKDPLGGRIILPPHYYLCQDLNPLLLPHDILNTDLPPCHLYDFGNLRHVDVC